MDETQIQRFSEETLRNAEAEIARIRALPAGFYWQIWRVMEVTHRRGWFSRYHGWTKKAMHCEPGDGKQFEGALKKYHSYLLMQGEPWTDLGTRAEFIVKVNAAFDVSNEETICDTEPPTELQRVDGRNYLLVDPRAGFGPG